MRFKIPQSPFVSRTVFELVLSRWEKADVEHRRVLAAAEARMAAAEARAVRAEQNTQTAFNSSLTAIMEARKAMGDALALSKTAAAMMFGPSEAGEVGRGPTVGESDREAAASLREKRDQERR